MGGDPIRTVPPVGALRVQDGGVPESHPHLLAHEFQIPAFNGDFQPARCAIMPARSGGGGSRIRPFWGYKVCFDGFPDGVQPGPAWHVTRGIH